MWAVFAVFFVLILRQSTHAACPNENPELQEWDPISDPSMDIMIDGEKRLLIGTDVNLRSITVTNGGVLVFDDLPEMKLRVSSILMEYEGELHIGSEDCPYEGQLDITLWGHEEDSTIPNLSAFGKKVIAVAPNGTIEIHGSHKRSWTRLVNSLQPMEDDDDLIIELQDDVSTWNAGDRIVITSTDFDMFQAEEFSLLNCPQCRDTEIRVQGPIEYLHYCDISYGVTMCGEVAMLTRNIKIHGEMEDECYGDLCEFFDYDTFGGQTQVLTGFRSAHIEGVELYSMGQQILGSYPIHFHRTYDVDEVGGYDPPTYVRDLSIHNCFSRCVTLHSTNGLLVEDVVGYITHGHCFFLEDGAEQRNTLRHNLGALTLAGSLLPHDRNFEMCQSLTDGTYGDYVPFPPFECMAVSNFWIAHPNNNLIDNVAAGSEEVGIFFIFHRIPTGDSIGLLPPYHSERSPMGIFRGNTAHCGYRSGVIIDLGIKIEPASEELPREYLSFDVYARYMPHETLDILSPRVPAVLEDITVYKSGTGVYVRGGDIVYQNIRVADTSMGLMWSSELDMPYDAGSHGRADGCIVVGESDNRGTNSPGNLYWAAGADGIDRTMPDTFDTDLRGVAFFEGPHLVNNTQFYRFVPTPDRHSSAIGFLPSRMQMTIKNTINDITLDDESLALFFGMEGTELFDTYDRDGDSTQVLFDQGGELTGYPGSYIVRYDNWLMKTDDCEYNEEWNAAVCPDQKYGGIYVRATTKELNMITVREDHPSYGLSLVGATRTHPHHPDTNTYKPIVMTGYDYSIHWNGIAPLNISFLIANFQRNEMVQVGLCYPRTSQFQVKYDLWLQMEDRVVEEGDMIEGSSLQEVRDDPDGMTYFWDVETRLLQFKLIQLEDFSASDPWNFCAAGGCQRIHIVANYDEPELSDCRSPEYIM